MSRSPKIVVRCTQIDQAPNDTRLFWKTVLKQQGEIVALGYEVSSVFAVVNLMNGVDTNKRSVKNPCWSIVHRPTQVAIAAEFSRMKEAVRVAELVNKELDTEAIEMYSPVYEDVRQLLGTPLYHALQQHILEQS